MSPCHCCHDVSMAAFASFAANIAMKLVAHPCTVVEQGSEWRLCDIHLPVRHAKARHYWRQPWHHLYELHFALCGSRAIANTMGVKQAMFNVLKHVRCRACQLCSVHACLLPVLVAALQVMRNVKIDSTASRHHFRCSERIVAKQALLYSACPARATGAHVRQVRRRAAAMTIPEEFSKS